MGVLGSKSVTGTQEKCEFILFESWPPSLAWFSHSISRKPFKTKQKQAQDGKQCVVTRSNK